MEGFGEKNPTGSKPPSFPKCFVCGSENPRGLKIEFNLCDHGVEAVFTPDATHAGYENLVHGGILSALLDEAVIWAVHASSDHLGVTAELNIRFRAPLLIGEPCTIRGFTTEDRGRYWIAQATIANKEGKLIARANAKVFPKKQNEY